MSGKGDCMGKASRNRSPRGEHGRLVPIECGTCPQFAEMHLAVRHCDGEVLLLVRTSTWISGMIHRGFKVLDESRRRHTPSRHNAVEINEGQTKHCAFTHTLQKGNESSKCRASHGIRIGNLVREPGNGCISNTANFGCHIGIGHHAGDTHLLHDHGTLGSPLEASSR